jgi:signal transduction histidine kinase
MSVETTQKGVVLVVDDNPTNLDLLFKHLDGAGYKVLVAQDGKMALRQAEYARPDIILLDVMMPELDGFETCRYLKANEATKDIPVIFTTALADIESKIKGFEVGAVDYLIKPFDRQEVTIRINAHLTIRRLQKKLQLEIIEREKVEEALRQSIAELETRNEELDTFAQMVAHDLKNPLGVMTGIAEVLVTDYAGFPPESMKEHLESIRRNGRKAANIIEELLVLASVRQREVKAMPLDMGAIVAEAQQRLADMIAESKAEITTPATWPIALGYAPWIEEVWVNYLSNAIKYGGRPPRLTLGATVQPDRKIRFWIKDNGPGLTPEDQARLFKPFTRLSQVRAQGHGLGLSIVHRIVKKLKGGVGVESEGIPGRGSTFSFTLPAAAMTKRDLTKAL